MTTTNIPIVSVHATGLTENLLKVRVFHFCVIFYDAMISIKSFACLTRKSLCHAEMEMTEEHMLHLEPVCPYDKAPLHFLSSPKVRLIRECSHV